MNKKPDEKEHPFPNVELLLIQKLHQEGCISIEDIEKLSNFLHKYLNLRADVFHEY